MKLLKIILTFFLFTSCVSKKQYYQKDEDGDGIADNIDANPESNDYVLFSNFNNELKSIVGDDSPIQEGKPKSLEEELYKLFEPESFNCGCDLKLKKNIAKLNNEKGYIPNEIKKDVIGVIGNHLDRRGSNNLVNSFYIKDKNGNLSKRIYAKDSPTALNYDVLNYLVTTAHGFSNLYYTIDCSGYLAGVINAGVGIDDKSIKLSSQGAVDNKKSLVVIRGVLNSPLYQAIKQERVFSQDNDLRKKVIQAIIDRVPTEFDDDESQIIINESYEVFLTSNTGNSSFNGKADMSASGGYNFIIGSVNSSVNSSGNIGKVSSFSEFNTYILNKNIDSYPVQIKLKDLKALLSSL